MGVSTRKYFDGGYEQPAGSSYEWIVRSSPGNGIRSDQDPNQGSCVKFGDKIYLQVNSLDNHWLTGGGDSGNAGVTTRGGPDWSYEWTVRSVPGNGERSYLDPLNGNCLQEGNGIFLQVNNLDNRWLTGGRDVGNNGVYTRNHLDGGYEEGAEDAYVWTVTRAPSLTYGSKISLQVNNLYNRWLTGGRGPESNIMGVSTRKYFDGGYEQPAGSSYEWIVRSSPGNGIRSDQDPNQGSCVKFGDKIYLQVNSLDNHWLTGGGDSGNAGVTTRGGPDWSYEWTVRSVPGNGERSYLDPLNGNCLQEGNGIFLQVNNLDNRWLTGGRDVGNNGVYTRNHLDGGYEEGAEDAYVWTVTRTLSSF